MGQFNGLPPWSAHWTNIQCTRHISRLEPPSAAGRPNKPGRAAADDGAGAAQVDRHGAPPGQRDIAHQRWCIESMYIESSHLWPVTGTSLPQKSSSVTPHKVQSGAEMSGRTRVYLSQLGRAGVAFTVSRSEHAWSGRLCRFSAVSGGTASSPISLILKGIPALAVRGQN